MNAERSSRNRAGGDPAGQIFTTRQIARLAKLTPGRVRRCVHAGFLTPTRGIRRRFEYTLRDLLVLRATRELLDAHLGPRRIAELVSELRSQLAGTGDVSSVRISIEHDHIVVTDGKQTWQPDSGQLLLDFSRPRAKSRIRSLSEAETSDEHAAYLAFNRGLSLDHASPTEAKRAYREALRHDPSAVPAHINLGRLEHESGNFAAAEEHYRAALALEPNERTAAFNLALLAEDQNQPRVAIRRYQQALLMAPDLADAHHRLARLYASLGNHAAARRHTRLYRTLVRGA